MSRVTKRDGVGDLPRTVPPNDYRAPDPDEDELTRRQRLAGSIGRIFKTLLLLLVISLAIVSSTLLNRADQIFVLKVFLVVFLAVLPGWLFLLFISLKGTGLYDEYVLNLYRLKIDEISNLPKPPPGSPYWKEWHEAVPKDLPDDRVAQNIYLKKFEAVYGKATVPESRRRRHSDRDVPQKRKRRLVERIGVDAFSPVVLATALFTVGWTVFVQPELARDLTIFVSLPLSGLPDLPEDALRFGFLGSYVFVLQHVVRRYFQIDLRNHAFVSAIARVIFVLGLIVAIHPIWALTGAPPEAELAFAFLLGFFPEMGLRTLRRRLSSFGKKSDASDLEKTPEERYPLRELDGLNVWVEARLVEEGIEDMQNLTTANLVDLLLNTRMPIGRVADWVDQAYLHLHVPAHDEGKRNDRAKLRRVGIRTATDLLDACDQATQRDEAFYQSFKRLLNRNAQGEDDDGPSAVEGLRRALEEGEANLWHVREWKKHRWLKAQEPSSQ